MQAGEKAVGCGASNVSELDELTFIKELHLGYGSVNCSDFRTWVQWIGL
jgi:hypothetical protein